MTIYTWYREQRLKVRFQSVQRVMLSVEGVMTHYPDMLDKELHVSTF